MASINGRYPTHDNARLLAMLGTENETAGVRRELRRRGVQIDQPKPKAKWPTWQEMIGVGR